MTVEERTRGKKRTYVIRVLPSSRFDAELIVRRSKLLTNGGESHFDGRGSTLRLGGETLLSLEGRLERHDTGLKGRDLFLSDLDGVGGTPLERLDLLEALLQLLNLLLGEGQAVLQLLDLVRADRSRRVLLVLVDGGLKTGDLLVLLDQSGAQRVRVVVGSLTRRGSFSVSVELGDLGGDVVVGEGELKLEGRDARGELVGNGGGYGAERIESGAAEEGWSVRPRKRDRADNVHGYTELLPNHHKLRLLSIEFRASRFRGSRELLDTSGRGLKVEASLRSG